MATNEVLLGPTDDDPAPTVRKSKKGKTPASSQVEAQKEQPGQKRKMRSKELAQKSRKLKQLRMELFLENETGEEEENKEEAGEVLQVAGKLPLLT